MDVTGFSTKKDERLSTIRIVEIPLKVNPHEPQQKLDEEAL